MALFNCNFYSKYLGYDTQVNIILPENRDTPIFDSNTPFKFQVLYLLHGLGDDCNGWLRGTRIESYAQEHKIVIVMPSGEDSFYTDGLNGKNFFSYLSEELPEKLQNWFPISNKPEDRFIAGLSMGGYGALKLGLTHPNKFAGIAAFSSVIDICKLPTLNSSKDFLERITPRLKSIFGNLETLPSKHILIDLLKFNIEEDKKIPPIIQYIGTEDFLYDMNVKFHKEGSLLGANIQYEEWTGSHSWDFWDTAVKKALYNLPIKRDIVK